MKTRVLLAVGAIAVVGLAGCGSSNDNGSSAGGSSSSSPMMGSSSMAPSSSASSMMGQTFGSACSAVPSDPSNPGSFTAMAKVPVATAASGNPVLSTLVGAVTKAGLADSLNGSSDITVFAPSNDAFAKIPADTMNAVMADPTKLKQILTYHVVPQRLAPAQLAGTFKTLEGATVTVAGSGSDFTVNGNAKVVCGNVQTANATVYIIDTVLMPTS
jgi:uncharacterized surface protein with fasciclin (FAS1) repeats